MGVGQMIMVRNTMKTAFCFVILICLVASNLDECSSDYSETGGRFKRALSAVNGGIKAPWLAAIGISQQNHEFTVICSGSIITRQFILTAASCFLSEIYQPSHVKVGANNIYSVFAEQREISEVKMHPDYDSVTREFYFDIAIVKTDKELKFNSRISPICLPDSSSLHPGSGFGISVQGWGKSEIGGVECDSRLEIFGESSRSKIDRWMPQLTTDVLFCADANLNDQVGVCHGDLGGPAIIRKYIDGGRFRYVLVGSVIGNVDRCGGGLPDIYNFIGNEKILNWIYSSLNLDLPGRN